MARSRGVRSGQPAPSLGSLTQQSLIHRCRDCGSRRITRLAMHLTDGTPVTFTSCHRCEHKYWEHDGILLSKDDVLHRTRKPA